MGNNQNNVDFGKMAVSRKEETVRLKKMLLHNKVCIINGMAGVGKTYFAKMYSCSHKNVIYIGDYFFHNYDLENRVIESSFERIINSSSLLIIDDIVEDINLYMNSVFFTDLKQMNPKNIILITRQDVCQSEVPVLTLHPFTLVQTYELIERITDNRYLDTEVEQIVRLSNGNPVMIQVVCSLLNNYSNIDEIWEQLSLEQNKRLISPFAQRDCNIPVLNDSEMQTYAEILMFGKIEICLLKRWDSRINEEIEKDITSLIAKKAISCDGTAVFGDYLAGDILDNYHFCYDYYVSIANNMKDDILNGISVEDKYAIALISALKSRYGFVDFIVLFYEQKIESQKKLEFTNELTRILQGIDYIKESLDKNIIPQVAKIEKMDENIESLIWIQDKIQVIIAQLDVELKGNGKAVEILDELSEIVKNPKKTKWDRVNSCIGFLGSIATLSTFSVNSFTTNAEALITQLKTLINMLLSMCS